MLLGLGLNQEGFIMKSKGVSGVPHPDSPAAVYLPRRSRSKSKHQKFAEVSRRMSRLGEKLKPRINGESSAAYFGDPGGHL